MAHTTLDKFACHFVKPDICSSHRPICPNISISNKQIKREPSLPLAIESTSVRNTPRPNYTPTLYFTRFADMCSHLILSRIRSMMRLYRIAVRCTTFLLP